MKQSDIAYMERKIVIGLITSTEYLNKVKDILELKWTQSKEAKILMSWCFEYHNKYKKAPQAHIQDIFMENIRTSSIPTKQAEFIEEILNSLSDEYTNEPNNLDYLIDQTIEYAKTCLLIGKAEEILTEVENGNIQEAESIIATYASPNKKLSNAVIPLDSVEQIKKAFEQNSEPLIYYPGDLGDMLNPAMTRESFVVFMGQNKGGKALRNGTPVLTNTGWVPIEQTKIGDTIYNAEGEASKIVGVHPQGSNDCYRFFFNDKTFIDSDEEHIWRVQTKPERFYKNSPTYGKWIDLTTKEIIDRCGIGDITNTSIRPCIPTTKPIQFTKKKLLIHPYILGLLLGDGCFRGNQPSICNPDKQLIESIKNHGYELKQQREDAFTFATRPEKIKVKKTKRCKAFTRCNQIPKEKYRLKTHLIHYKLWGLKSESKFVPNQYLYSNVQDRWNLVYGLMDTDGTIDKRGKLESYSTSSKQLAKDIIFLLRSLGCRCSITSKIPTYTHNGKKLKGRRSYTISINSTETLFKLKRKSNIQKEHMKTNNRIIVKIKYLGKKQTTCITTSSKDHMFITKDFIPTHNSWILLDAAFRAAKQGKKVAFFQAGDMSQAQMERRQGIYLSRKSDMQKFCGPLYIPVVDCVWNQNGLCEQDFREDPEAPFPLNNRSEKDIRGILSKGTKPITDKDLINAFHEFPDHRPCYECKRRNMGHFRGCMWYKRRERVTPLTWKECYHSIAKKHRPLLSKIRIITYPSESLSMNKLSVELDILEQQGFTPDVVISDYLDIHACDYDTRMDQKRIQEDKKYQRARRLAQERKVLFLSVSQADAAGFDSFFLQKKNFTESRTKLDHVTAMFGLNMTITEKRKGVLRINEIVGRETEGISYVNVLHRLQMGRPILGSFY